MGHWVNGFVPGVGLRGRGGGSGNLSSVGLHLGMVPVSGWESCTWVCTWG